MTLQWALTDVSRVRNTDFSFFKLKMFIFIKKHGYYQETKKVILPFCHTSIVLYTT